MLRRYVPGALAAASPILLRGAASVDPSGVSSSSQSAAPSSASSDVANFLRSQTRCAASAARAEAPSSTSAGSSVVEIAANDLKQSGRVVLVASWIPDEEIMATQGQLLQDSTVQEVLKKKHCALYNPQTGDCMQFENIGETSKRSAVVNWVKKQNPRRLPVVLIPSQEDSIKSLLASTVTVMGNTAGFSVSVSTDAWSLIVSTFMERRRTVPNLQIPKNMVDAFYLLSTAAFVPTEGVKDEESTSAHLTWQTLLYLYLKLGTTAARSTKNSLSAVEQIMRKASQPVKPLVLSVNMLSAANVKIVGKKVKVSVFNPQTGVKKHFSLNNLTADKNLIDVSKALSEQDTVSLIIPTGNTQVDAVRSLVRAIRPRCPLVLVPPIDLVKAGLRKHKIDDADILSSTEDPEKMWAALKTFSNDSEDTLNIWCAQVGDAKKPKQVLGHGLIPKQAVVKGTIAQAAKDSAVSVATVNAESKADAQSVIGGTSVKPYITRKLNEYNDFLTNPVRKAKEEKVLEDYQKYIVIDLETTIVKSYKRVANPFDPKNHIVLPGLLDYEGKMTIPKAYTTKQSPYRLPSLDKYQVIVGHNLKFDMLHLWKDPALIKFLQRGGKIWDTMYGEYLLTGHQVALGFGAGLDEVSKRYGGTIKKLDEVKQAWKEGRCTSTIPISTLTPYLVGDLKNTELIFKAQRLRAVEQHQMVACHYRMDGLLCTTEMEYNGLQIDKEACARATEKVVAKGAIVKRQLEECRPPQLGPMKPLFNWGSMGHLTSYFFGGSIPFETGTHLMPGKSEPQDEEGNAIRQRAQQDYSQCEVGQELYMGPPENPSVAAQCIFAAKRSIGRSGKLFKYYVESALRNKGLRSGQAANTVFYDDLEDIDANYRSFLLAVGCSEKNDVGADDVITDNASMASFMKGGYKDITIRRLCNHDKSSTAAKDSLTLTSAQLQTAEGRTKLLTYLEAHLANKETLSRAEALFITPNSSTSHISHFWEKLLADELYTASLPAAKSTNKSGEDIVKSPPVVGFADLTTFRNFVRHEFHDLALKHDVLPGELPKETEVDVDESTPAKKGKKAKAPKKVVKAKVLKLKQMGSNNSTTVVSSTQWCAEALNVLTKLCSPVTAACVRNEREIAKSFEVKLDARGGDAKKINLDSPSTKAKILHKNHFLAITDAELQRTAATSLNPLTLMSSLGFTTATANHDVFELPSHCPPLPTVSLRGKLLDIFPEAKGAQGQENRLKRQVAMNDFTSKETKKLQVGIETLKWFKSMGDEASANLAKMREHEKLLSTYYDDTQGGMMSLVHAHDSRIHHELIHNKTQTGRLASANPNCQNIAKDGDLRTVFVSRFGTEGLCIEADYSQLEVICMAALSQDKQMTKDIQNKVDFHCKRVVAMRPDLNLTYEDVFRKAKIEKIPEFVEMRQKAKSFSFQRQYGAGAKSISESTGLHIDTVYAMIDNEREVYAGAEDFGEMVKQSVGTFNIDLQDGDRNKDGEFLMKGRFVAPTGQAYVFKEQDRPDFGGGQQRFRGRREERQVNFSPTKLKNYPVQGFAGEVTQFILGQTFRHFAANNSYDGKALLTNTVHDCIWIDAKKEVQDVVCRDLERIMTSVRQFLNANWPEIACEVEFPVEVVAGNNMGSLKEVKH